MRLKKILSILTIAIFCMMVAASSAYAAQNLSAATVAEMAGFYTAGSPYYDNLADGDVCMIFKAGSTREFVTYIYDDDSAQTEDGEVYVAPDYTSPGVAYSGNARWVKVKINANNILIKNSDPSIIFDVDPNSGDTNFWMGVQADAQGDDDDIFMIGDGTTPGTNPFVRINTKGQMSLLSTFPGSDDNTFIMGGTYTGSSTVRGISVNTDNSGTGSSDGIDIVSHCGGTGSQDHYVGVQIRPTAEDGVTLDKMYGIHITLNEDGNNAVANGYGLYVNNSSGTFTNYHAIYSAAGYNYFAGNTAIGTTVSATRELSVNGDILWNGNLYSTGSEVNILTSDSGGIPVKMGALWVSSSYTGTAPTNGAYIKGNVGLGTATPGGQLDIAPGTTGGLYFEVGEATTDITASATITIQTDVPSGSKLLGCQLRVDSALATGETWNAQYATGATQSIASAQAVAQNTKVNKFFDENAATAIASDEVDVTIQRSSNPGVDVFTAQGTIRAIVYYQGFTAMADAS